MKVMTMVGGLMLFILSSSTGAAPPAKPVSLQCFPLQASQLSEGLVSDPAVGSEHGLVSLEGPGCFLSARVVKQGGDSDITFVKLALDGRTVVNRSVAALRNWGTTEDNSYGVMVFTNGSTNTVTIGFGHPLLYERSLELGISVDENGISQVIGTVIHGQ
jgi:hypothetical protein